MRSTSDLNTAARIRNAAISEFAEHGFGASVRAIAAHAGVTAGLVMHHFGTKNGLKLACDEFVVARLVADKADGSIRVENIAAHFSSPAGGDAPPFAAYVRRMLAEGSPSAHALFDALVSATRDSLSAQQAAGALRSDLDVAALAPVMTLYGLAPVAMPALLARAVGAEQIDADTLTAAAAALSPVLTGGLFSQS